MVVKGLSVLIFLALSWLLVFTGPETRGGIWMLWVVSLTFHTALFLFLSGLAAGKDGR